MGHPLAQSEILFPFVSVVETRRDELVDQMLLSTVAGTGPQAARHVSFVLKLTLAGDAKLRSNAISTLGDICTDTKLVLAAVKRGLAHPGTLLPALNTARIMGQVVLVHPAETGEREPGAD